MHPSHLSTSTQLNSPRLQTLQLQLTSLHLNYLRVHSNLDYLDRPRHSSRLAHLANPVSRTLHLDIPDHQINTIVDRNMVLIAMALLTRATAIELHSHTILRHIAEVVEKKVEVVIQHVLMIDHREITVGEEEENVRGVQ